MPEETRWNNGKLEKKDPITGVWVIHPMQFYDDNRDWLDKAYQEMAEEEEKERQEMFKPEKAKEFMEHVIEYRDLWEDDKEPPTYDVEKVVQVKSSGGFSKSSNHEIIFDGKYRDKNSRFVAGCSAYSGDFYEPPSEECWFFDIREEIESLEKDIKKQITPDPKRGFLDPEKKRKGLQGPEAFSPIKTTKQFELEKHRLEGIYRHKIDRLAYLKKYQPTWKYEK